MSKRAAAAVDPDAHFAAKEAALRERRAPRIYFLADEAEARAVAAWRRGPADLRRQARLLLRRFQPSEE